MSKKLDQDTPPNPDEVLRRMLNTPPDPHKTKKKAKKKSKKPAKS